MSLKVGSNVEYTIQIYSLDIQAISATDAASLDKDLMDVNIGGWSLDQLMELAGLSVSQAGELFQALTSNEGHQLYLCFIV